MGTTPEEVASLACNQYLLDGSRIDLSMNWMALIQVLVYY